jgi:polyhydroxybutyrate depolymerase
MLKRLVAVVLVLLGLTQIFITSLGMWYLLANQTNGTVVSSGETRRYLLHVPESYNPDVATPLVITIHGFLQWPAHQALASHWNAVADEHGFIVVYPEGTGFPRRWRAGGYGAEADDTQEEIAFIEDLIDALSQQYNIDPARVYANGLSNGGGMSFLLSCTLSERIAAIGTVAGAYGLSWEQCTPERPVPAIVFHGTDDPIVPFDGGPAGPDDTQLPAIRGWVEILAEHNGCEGAPVDLPPNGEVRGVTYEACAADVVFYTIEGGGHTWPGGQGIPTFIGGHTTQDIDASRVMWAFFDAHPMPAHSMPPQP